LNAERARKDTIRGTGRPGAVSPARLAPLARFAPTAAFALVLACVPAIFTRVGFFTMANAVVMGIMAIATVGLVLVMGYAGQVSLGQAAFFGVGAYSSGVLTVEAGTPPPLAMLAGMVLAGLLAAIVGRSIFRARGHYLAMATLAFGLVAFFLAKELPFTGGPSGLPDVPKLALGGIVLGSDLRYWWLVAAVLFIAVLLARNLVDSRVGRALRALGDSEPAAATSAVDVRRHKLIVFVIGAVLAAVAGSLYAHWTTFVDPTSTLDLLLSIQLLIMATVGGLRSVWGAPLGAFVVVSLSQGARELLPRLSTRIGGEFEIIVYGLALIAVLLFLPDGLAGGAGRLARAARTRSRRHAAAAPGEAGP
jgi:branched-chain amino acid transport system permease protein